jgi:hypothetical protein
VKEGFLIVIRHPRIIRTMLACLMLVAGLGAIAGCGGATGSGAGTGAKGEEVPEGVVKLKEAMKERAAAKKGRPGVPGRATRGQ